MTKFDDVEHGGTELEDPVMHALENPEHEVSGNSVCSACCEIPWEVLAEPLYEWSGASVDTRTQRDNGVTGMTIIQINEDEVEKRLQWDTSREEQEQSQLTSNIKKFRDHLFVRRVSVPTDWQETSSCPVCLFIRGNRYLRQSTSIRNDVPSSGLISPGLDIGWRLLATSLGPESWTQIRHLVPLVDLDCRKILSLIQECGRSHGTLCRPTSTAGLYNLRVIDCKRRVVVAAPSHCRYVALSYLWGQSRDTELGDEAPQTIEDSISVTMRLGYNFLWIDRYCIDQDNGDETLRQIMQMADIYAAAQVTIVAAAGDDPSYGLPGSHKSRGFVGKIRNIYLFEKPNTSLMAPTQAKWFNRAWTYQEAYFSNRRLLFSEYHTIYMCNYSIDFETPAAQRLTDMPLFRESERSEFLRVMRNCTPRSHFATGAQQEMDRLVQILRILTGYNGRQLTYESDALKAILGTLRTFEPHLIHHWWGVPVSLATSRLNDQIESDEMALLWRARLCGIRRVDFPSWSPLGWEAEVHWYWRYNQDDGSCHVRSPWQPSDNSNHPVLMQFDESEMWVQQGHERISLRAAIAQGSAAAVKSTQLLGLTGWVVHLHQGPEISFYSVRLALNKLVDLLLIPYWDILPDRYQPHQYQGVLFKEATKVQEDDLAGPAMELFLMIVRRFDCYYERIAIVHLPQDLVSSSRQPIPEYDTWIESPICRFHFHERNEDSDKSGEPSDDGSPSEDDREGEGDDDASTISSKWQELMTFEELIFRPETGIMTFADQPEAEPLDVSDLELTSKDWWRPYFRQETIILG